MGEEMSRKVDIRTRMSEVQKEFSALTAELKEMELLEKKVTSREKYKDYLYKIGTYGHTLMDPEKIQDVLEEDRETAHLGMSGLVYTGFEAHSQHFDYVMLKSKEEYPRVKKILTLLEAAAALADEKTKDKEKHLKVLLGEHEEAN